MLNTNYYHTSYSDDLNGVEVSAAIKNIFSMAVGAAKGLCSKNISDEVREKNYLNTASALIKQSIFEMEIFVEHLKGKNETVFYFILSCHPCVRFCSKECCCCYFC